MEKVIFKNVEITGELTVSNIISPNIKTYNIYSTNGDNSWIDLHVNVHGYKDLHSDGLIKSENITTRFLNSTSDNRIYDLSLYIRNKLFIKDFQPTKLDNDNKDTVNINAKLILIIH